MSIKGYFDELAEFRKKAGLPEDMSEIYKNIKGPSPELVELQRKFRESQNKKPKKKDKK